MRAPWHVALYSLCFGGMIIAAMANGEPSTTFSQNPQANTFFLHAREYLAKADPRTGGTFANGREAIRLYQDAVKADPKFALAYVEMARAWLGMGYSNPGAATGGEIMPHVKAALAAAIRVEPALPDAHRMLAAVAFNLDYDWDTADREYREALRLQPDNAATLTSYGDYLGAMGRFDEALAHLNRAAAIAHSARTDLIMSRIYYSNHQYARAIDLCKKSLAEEDNQATRFYLGLMYLAQNDFAKAMPELIKTTEEKNGGALAGLAYAYAMQGDRARALELLNRLFANRDSGAIVPYRIAAVYLALGDKAQAIEWLRLSYSNHDNWTAQLKVDPVMDPFRSDPRFQQLMRDMKFA